MIKKREILPTLDKTINALVALSADCARLEMMDNDQASRRIKRDLSAFKETELKAFSTLIYDIRDEIKMKPRRKLTENQKNNLKPKNKQHESESTESGNA